MPWGFRGAAAVFVSIALFCNGPVTDRLAVLYDLIVPEHDEGMSKVPMCRALLPWQAARVTLHGSHCLSFWFVRRRHSLGSSCMH